MLSPRSALFISLSSFLAWGCGGGSKSKATTPGDPIPGDSMVVGGSFSYAKSLVSAMDKKAEDKKAATPVTVLTTDTAAA